jgi:hypothetical protein
MCSDEDNKLKNHFGESNKKMDNIGKMTYIQWCKQIWWQMEWL